ncbi:MAG TPA: oligopeptide/dipeptide ABC transporter ATP-binding protein [Acetobacteraceae bacterium]|nr:oligopeptide/dipeptide ABC transporter ATP-binding protein [Acetobacteraceae bacterium]
MTALLSVRDLAKHYPMRGGRTLRALAGVSFDMQPGEVLGIVGESGSGKTTLGRVILRLMPATSGTIRFRGQDITRLSRRAVRPLRRHMQIVFQDPYASLNPRMTVEQILGIPLGVHEPMLGRTQRRARIEQMLHTVGLFGDAADRYPHEFSGGQRQRIGIARALICRPELLVADEPVSALDVSVQAQVINLLLDLREQLGLAILFIAHDLAVVGLISDRVAVMYLGRIVELATTADLFARPRHPYTEALFAAVPDVGGRRERVLLKGDMPSPIDPPSGCAFRTRCRYAEPACAAERPPLVEHAPGHFAACPRPELVLSSPLPERAAEMTRAAG